MNSYDLPELLEFDKIKNLVSKLCYTKDAKVKAQEISVFEDYSVLTIELNRTFEIKNTIVGNSYFPDVKFETISDVLSLLRLEGSMLTEEQFLDLKKVLELGNSCVRFLKGKKQILPYLFQLVEQIEELKSMIAEIEHVVEFDATVKTNASHELAKIRKELTEKRKESDSKFYKYVHELRKLGYLRENEESYINGRRTLAVLVDYKAEIGGFVHGKSESGKTIFIEPGATISINNDIAEFEIDERREINRILRELTNQIRPHVIELSDIHRLLIELDFLIAKAKFAIQINATLPEITKNRELSLVHAFHPLLLLQNKELNKKTIPLDIQLNFTQRMVLISGPNAGGKSVTLKTIGLLQIMLQSGLLVSVKENSKMSFFNHILIDIGDSQSIEQELSTYSSRLKKMISILETVNQDSLVLMDEFGSGTDPELGGALAEVVLEKLVKSQTLGVVTTHFSNLKVLVNQLDGIINGSMLFDLESLEPKFLLAIGEPGSSYTFEVAERVGFPKDLIKQAKGKLNKQKIDLNTMLAEVQQQKNKLNEAKERMEHEEFLRKISKEKYETLFQNWRDKIERERDRKIELARLADFGQKYLRLMDEWNKNEDRKSVIKRFIDGITAETKKRKDLEKQNRIDKFSEKKVARIKPLLKIGSKVKVLNGSEVGLIESIKDDKVNITFGILKMTVNIHNLELVRD